MRFRLAVTCVAVLAVVVPVARASGQDFCFEAALTFAAGLSRTRFLPPIWMLMAIRISRWPITSTAAPSRF